MHTRLIHLVVFLLVLFVCVSTCQADLIAYWPTDEGAGTTVQDKVGIWPGEITGDVTWAPGYVGSALETSLDGVDWTPVADVPKIAQAPGSPDYTANTAIDLVQTLAKFVKITVTSGWGLMPQYGLSEVRFFYIPTYPREPKPADGGIASGATVDLSWRPGRKAASHEVYLGTTADDLALIATTTEGSVPGNVLDYATMSVCTPCRLT